MLGIPRGDFVQPKTPTRQKLGYHSLLVHRFLLFYLLTELAILCGPGQDVGVCSISALSLTLGSHLKSLGCHLPASDGFKVGSRLLVQPFSPFAHLTPESIFRLSCKLSPTLSRRCADIFLAPRVMVVGGISDYVSTTFLEPENFPQYYF